MQAQIDLPATLEPQSTQSVVLVSGALVDLPKCNVRLRRWSEYDGKYALYRGQKVGDWNKRYHVEVDGEPAFVENWVVSELRKLGWAAFWPIPGPDGRGRIRHPRYKEKIPFPGTLGAIYRRLMRNKNRLIANPGLGGCWDATAIKGDVVLFCEVKKAGEPFRDDQIGWLSAGLEAGLNKNNFLVVEYVLAGEAPVRKPALQVTKPISELKSRKAAELAGPSELKRELRNEKIVLRFNIGAGRLEDYRTDHSAPEAHPESFVDGRFALFEEAEAYAISQYGAQARFSILGHDHEGFEVSPTVSKPTLSADSDDKDVPILQQRNGKTVLRYAKGSGKIGDYRTDIRGPEAFPRSFIDGRYAEYTEAQAYAKVIYDHRSEYQILGQKHLGYEVAAKP